MPYVIYGQSLIENQKFQFLFYDSNQQINPQHTLPTLVDNGFTLWESKPIMMYLAEKYGKNDSLYPKDPKSRALVNQRLFFDSNLYDKFAAYYYANMFYGKPLVPENYKPMETTMEYFNIFLETSKYAAGDHITLADLALVTTISNYDVLGFDFTTYDFVREWYQKCQQTIKDYHINYEGAMGFKNLASKK